MWKQSKQEDPSQRRSQNTSKKSKVMNCTKGREKERAVSHEAQRGFIYSLVQWLNPLFIFLLASYNSIIEY